MVAVLVACTLLPHGFFGYDAIGVACAQFTATTSTSTSSETQTTEQAVRVDTAATRVLAVDGIGGVVADETFPQLFADTVVQAAVDAARVALVAGPPASLFVRGPTLVATSTTLVDSIVETHETGRQSTPITTADIHVGPECIGIGDRDVPNTTPCTGCIGTTAVPAVGQPYCVVSGQVDTNTNVDTHTVIQELKTTTDTYRTTETYVLRGSFLDHFMLYAVKGSASAPKLAAFGPVTLADTFGSADYDVKKLPALGLPADKNGEGRADATTSLAQYALKRRKTAAKFLKIANVTATSQCGALTLTLLKPDTLLVPVARQTAPFDPLSAEVDHFLCYKAKAQTKLAKGTQVDVVDDFQTRRYDLKKPTRLCFPVTTAGSPAVLKGGMAVPFTATTLRHAAGDLVCYQAKAASKTIPQNGCGAVDPKAKGTKIVPKPPKHQKRIGVPVNGPLGPATLDTSKEVELCVPATATLP